MDKSNIFKALPTRKEVIELKAKEFKSQIG
jgi:hypothetical protein